ncbi:GNAT family N-acetyltransferase [Paenibacillus jilunlii]|uniref:Acetyltransferase (GNAT) family protein n=1 Tax=Paenibacillus jilunlii TaxID=682956 RepID=A0A1G9GT82_9BACL|nr:GNAT family N-acetyltransferase [Paenibacillus jilunlii]KWX73906.1 GCN5 family acetyltransferase [Paenibacillus jilunlii]SDL03896.1 Acetyltransferase (GNAT) family protein [Paenibacillus jilunlii]
MTKPGRLTIHPLTQDDIQSVYGLFEESISDAFAQEGLASLQDDIQSEVDNKQQMAASALDPEHSDTYFLVAKLDGKVAGTISFAPCGEDIRSCTEHQLDDVGELGSLYILPSCQGQGIGSALIRELMAYLKSRGIEEFCLDSGYKRAQQRWLRKFGEPHTVVKDYWGPDSVHMVWLCKVRDYLV